MINIQALEHIAILSGNEDTTHFDLELSHLVRYNLDEILAALKLYQDLKPMIDQIRQHNIEVTIKPTVLIEYTDAELSAIKFVMSLAHE